MNFGSNLQYLRRNCGSMTQEQLAQQMGVSRQTISKWESGEGYPELTKLVELCDFFSCSMDELLRGDLSALPHAAPVRIERVKGFRYGSYLVISRNPREDSRSRLAAQVSFSSQFIPSPVYLGWSFPYVSNDQKHRYGLRGYVSAIVLPEGTELNCRTMDFGEQPDESYAVFTLREPFSAGSERISQAYSTIMEYLTAHGIKKKHTPGVLPCFERVYFRSGTEYMDVYVHCESAKKEQSITVFI